MYLPYDIYTKDVVSNPREVPKAVYMNLTEHHTLKVVLLYLDRRGWSSCVLFGFGRLGILALLLKLLLMRL